MRNSVRRPRGIVLFLLVGFSLVLSACTSEEAKRQGLDVLRKSEINAPRFEADDLLGEINPQREKISRLEVIAPRAGTLLSSYRVLTGYTRGEKIKLGQDFRLVEDIEPTMREALGYLFEVRPEADKYALVELKVDASTVYTKEKSCEPFVTTVNLQLQIQEVSADGAMKTEIYKATGTDDSCTFAFLPFADAVQDPLDEAFADAFAQALRARNSLEQVMAPRRAKLRAE